MWRWKYLMAGRKFDLEKSKNRDCARFRGSSPVERGFSQACRHRDPDSWQFRAKKWIKYRCIDGVSRGRFEKLFFDRQDEKIDSMNVTAAICTRVTGENKNVVSVLDSVIKSFCNFILTWKLHTVCMPVCLKFYVSFACHSALSLQVFITVEQFIIRYNY